MRARAAVAAVLLGIASPALARGGDAVFPLEPAAVLDPSTFTHAAALKAHPSPAGVSRVRLSPPILAVARADLADVRVVDDRLRQWPFVLVPDAGRASVDLRVDPARSEAGSSRRPLVPPSAPLTLDGLTLHVDRERFDRSFVLSGIVAGAPLILARGRLARIPGGSDELTVRIPTARVDALRLVVDDGDEVPLPITSARASAVVAEIRLLAPAGDYTLLAGDADAKAPRYEVASDRGQVLAAPAGEAEVGAPAPNPRYRAHLPNGEAMDRIALWVALGLAVGVLGILSLRLARKGDP